MRGFVSRTKGVTPPPALGTIYWRALVASGEHSWSSLAAGISAWSISQIPFYAEVSLYKLNLHFIWQCAASCITTAHNINTSVVCNQLVTINHQLSLFNPLSPELNPICYFLTLLAHDFFHVSRIRVKSLTLRLLMSYIYIYIYIWSIYSWCF
jgi:hypothetical protein